ncbi:hypothetical protein WJX75_003181 [Coccomyxa subellipsoidea]|uniref:Alpha-amylase n=1 Tax=Coccomyxa subellipsoidea TaxID=248742 RepID=A0ABR2Z2Z3_9CHLO
MQVSGRAFGSSGCSCSTIPHQFGRQVLTFQNRSLLQSKRAVAQRVVAASTPVATVEKKLKKTASKIADTATDVAEKVTLSAKPDLSKVVLLQAFGWDSCDKGGWYKIVKEKIPDIKASGVTHVWLPPPSQSVSRQGYLPGQLYNLQSLYGSAEELKELLAALKEAGLVPIADIVINHRCADAQDENGVWNNFRDDVSHSGEKIDWGQWAITGNDPEFGGTGNPDTGDDYGPAPDLDHLNEDLRSHLKDWLKHLKDDIGYEGWRFDFVKGYGPEFVKEYVLETVGEGTFNVGEYWVDLRWNGSDLDYNQNDARQTIVNWIDGAGSASAAFDFPTKGILQEAVKNCQYWRLRDENNKPPGVIGYWPEQSVTFIDNHDTGSTQQHWPFPDSHVDLGYAYLFTHPGNPTIFWDHYFDNGYKGVIDQLVQLRKRAGITAGSKIEILAADHDFYVARINDNVTIKMGPRYDMGDLLPKEEEGWKFAVSGTDFGIWEKTA